MEKRKGMALSMADQGMDRKASQSTTPTTRGRPMNGKLLVLGIVAFFLVFFVYESWLMRGLPY